MRVKNTSKTQILLVAILGGVIVLGLLTAKVWLPWLPGGYPTQISQLPCPVRLMPYDINLTLYSLPVHEINNRSVHGSILKYLTDYKNPCWFEHNTTQLGLRCLPYFIELGVAKSGTTSFFKQLVKHPDIAEPKRKEFFYWSDPKGYANQDKYLDYFRNASIEIFNSKDSSGYHHKITFEATPAYFSSPWSSSSGNRLGADEPKYTLAHTLYSIYPHMRLIILMRNPTDRLFSHYHHFNKKAYGGEDFHDHVMTGIQMMNNCLANRTLRSCAYDQALNSGIKQGRRITLHFGMYYPYAKEWLSVFPRNQMLFIKSEDFYANSTRVVREAFNFLSLAEPSSRVIQSIDEDMNRYYKKQKTLDVKKKSYRAKMLPKTRVILDNFYQPYNQKLAELLGDDKFLFK